MMHRCLFLAAVLAFLMPGAGTLRAADARQVIELRTYTFASEEKLQLFAGVLEKAMVPALNRLGAKPVGVFRLRKDDNPALKLEADPARLYVVIPHASAEDAFSAGARIHADAEFVAAAKPVMDTPMKDPVYLRYEAQFMRGFTECPAVTAVAKGDDRVVQLRIYESHNSERAARKVEMFNEGGEIAIFRRVGMNPVFFGQSAAGTQLPNLTYMLGFDSPGALAQAWAAFLKDPEWLRLKNDPKYKDTVSNITNLILRPLPGSQI